MTSNYFHDYYRAHRRKIIARTKARYQRKSRSVNYRKIRCQRSADYHRENRVRLNHKRMHRYYVARRQKKAAAK